MSSDFIHNRGRGPEIVGTRITVYNLVPYFLDPAVTESYIGELYELTPEQIAAARAYVINNTEAVLARHAQIEARLKAGNPPEVREKAKEIHTRFLKFREWAAQRKRASQENNDSPRGGCHVSPRPFPS